MTRVVRFHELGGPEVLRIEKAEVRLPGPGEIRMAVKALGLNRAEALLRRGQYIETATLPSGLGFEAAGVVEAVGDGVDGFAIGDAVSVVPPLSQLRWPAYAELAVFPATLAVRHPAALDWADAAASWMQYLTAWGALIDTARLRRGDVVAITAASSSTGLAAIQIANMVGATPVAITRTHAKADALLKAGAAHVVASRDEDIAARLRAIAGADGVRVVFDPVAGPAFEPLAEAMARGGMLIQYGALSPDPTPYPVYTALAKCLTLRGFLVHEVTGDPQRLAAGKAFVLDGLRSGALKPVIARRFAFDDIVAAHRYLESNEQFGKVVVTL